MSMMILRRMILVETLRVQIADIENIVVLFVSCIISIVIYRSSYDQRSKRNGCLLFSVQIPRARNDY